MVNQTIQSWAQVKGLSMPDDNAALLQAGGYLITYAYVANSAMRVSVPVREDSLSKEIKKTLRKALRKAGMLAYTKGLLWVNIGIRSKKGYHEKFEQATQILLAELPRLGVKPADTCRYCAMGDCEDFTLEAGVCFPAHTRCKTQKADTLLAEIEDNQMNSNIPLGVVGAVLGGIIGSIPTFLTAHFFDTIYSLLFALIPILSYLGYKKCKGLMGTAVPFLISGISLLCTVFLVLLYTYAGFTQDLVSMGITDQDIAEIGKTPLSLFFLSLTDPEVRGDLLLEFGTPLLFCGLGIYIAWGIISKNNRHKKQEAQDLVNR